MQPEVYISIATMPGRREVIICQYRANVIICEANEIPKSLNIG